MPTAELIPLENQLPATEEKPLHLIMAASVLKLAQLIPRYVSTEPGAVTLIETTSAIKVIEDRETYDLLLDEYLPELQKQSKRGESHHEPFKNAFHAGHKAACALEKDDVKAAQTELARCKTLCAQSKFAEREKFIEPNIDAAKLIADAVEHPKFRKFLSVNYAALAEQLKTDGEFFDCPDGVTVGERGKSPTIRAAK